ncbi:hypothetical protein OG381_46035 [Streptomyces sp. NBC_00490]|uniref:RHS repeat-associated core domain-containing protein n=1 Tax=Streptomyces sp. NBC_00490 TaxID=2903657 RepID=UPI002E16C5BE
MSGVGTGFVREPSGTLVAMRSGGSSQYYLTDVQNSVIGLADTTAKRTATYTYGPYGEQRANSGTQEPFRYTSAYLDPAGLYKVGALYCDSRLGRFTQPDPSRQEDDPYLFTGGDPVSHTNPTGTTFMSFAESASKKIGFASDVISIG